MLITTMGFSISKHYCRNNLISVTINQEAKSCCGMNSESGCCHNETTFHHLEDDFVYSSFVNNSTINQIDLLFPLFYIIAENISENENETIFRIPETPPPLKIQTVLSHLQTYLC